MLITELKDKQELENLLKDAGKLYAVLCYGCKELNFPYEEVIEFVKGKGIDYVMFDYLCNAGFADKYIERYNKLLMSADSIIVFSCGVGVQSLTEELYKLGSAVEGKKVFAGCNTMQVNGFQGLTANASSCGQCGTCFLNYTAGICPITACSKSLVNGQCGGAKNGKCEVDKDMDCGWEKIDKAMKKYNGKTGDITKIQLHNFKIVP